MAEWLIEAAFTLSDCYLLASDCSRMTALQWIPLVLDDSQSSELWPHNCCCMSLDDWPTNINNYK